MVTKAGSSIRVDPWTGKQLSKGDNNDMAVTDKIGIENFLCCALYCKHPHLISAFDFTYEWFALWHKL